MKKILIVLAAAITIVSCKEADKKVEATTSASTAPTANEATNNANATNTSTAPQQNTVDPATLTKVEWLDGMDKDFGKIEEGKNLDVSFRFKNVGNTPLVISNVNASCGCTVPETPQKPYQPGETGVIKASFNSSGKSGTQSKQVYMTANTDPAMTTLTFHVEVKTKS
ncbi:MAG TPA: DUF1573 domain-containing protein [Chitinophagaceae bacterium]|nr:DUF1573 domain-containing protein [Chitinophagaceae bacterium]